MLTIFSIFVRNKKITNYSLTRYGVFALSFLFLFIFQTSSLFAANLTVSPSSVTTKIGKTFTVDLVVNNNTDAINAVAALITYPSDTISITSV